MISRIVVDRAVRREFRLIREIMNRNSVFRCGVLLIICQNLVVDAIESSYNFVSL